MEQWLVIICLPVFVSEHTSFTDASFATHVLSTTLMGINAVGVCVCVCVSGFCSASYSVQDRMLENLSVSCWGRYYQLSDYVWNNVLKC